ncbi:peptidoglycan binding domain-containing protein [Salicibibacter kimchii]|uniref:YoaR-like putative peptidoglycan binding domain-containing protein n=1 Tax=Salicibibacter kimchii TaxID=2099786 RepID=A0A345C2F7_9BACI|nr:peptidoglycan binding domain-containing protein [Salicibibacter kimchii]AXF57388.1 hypothetical protein DT065_16235 [Salicibibacter kimchii]
MVNRENFTLPGASIVDVPKYDQFIETLNQQVFLEPVNATINEQRAIEPGQKGYRLDREAFENQFYSYLYSKVPATVEVPLLDVYPKVDSELLADIRVQQIGQYATFLNPNNTSL